MRARRHRSGTALIEAVIVAPAFALLLGSTLALHSMYSAKLAAKERARRLAWLQAESGDCPDSSCSSPNCVQAANDIDSAFEETGVAGAGLALDDFLGDVRDFFVGKTTRAVAHVESKTSSIIPGGVTRQVGVTELTCNTRSRTTENEDSVLEHACRTGLGSTDYAREVCR